MSDKAMVPKESDSRIAAWGERDEVREIARRVQLMAPGGKKLGMNEALALAQGAVAHGLDPFNGEIWFIPDSGLMAGIKGLRKAARKQVANFWPEFEQITDPDTRRLLLIPEGALAFRCILRDSATILAYADMWKALQEKGVPVDIIPTVIGKRPYTEGMGYLKAGERTKMDPVQCAMKRAEADALKRRFDLPFAAPTGDMEIIDADWSETEPVVKLELSPAETAEIVSKGKTAAAALYDDPAFVGPTPTPRPPARRPLDVRVFVQGKIAGHRTLKGKASKNMVGMLMGLMESAWMPDLDPKEREGKRRAALFFLFGRASGKELDDAETLGLRDWIAPEKGKDGWVIADETKRELWDMAIEGAGPMAAAGGGQPPLPLPGDS